MTITHHLDPTDPGPWADRIDNTDDTTTIVDPETAWLARAWGGLIDTPAAHRATALARAHPERLTPLQRDLLAGGDLRMPPHQYPERYAHLDIGPPPTSPDTTTPIGDLAVFVDWHKFFDQDHEGEEWTIDGLFARGRGHSVNARGKTGKSELVLYHLLRHVTDPDNTDLVIYLDYEMSPSDLYDRIVDDFGYTADHNLARLYYWQLPNLAPLDTPQGAGDLDRILSAVQATDPDAHLVVVIDTMSRSVEGPENENDTAIRFYRFAGTILRRHGCTWARLDHLGHEGTHARGGSAKRDDVDVNWELRRMDGGAELVNRGARMSWVPERSAWLRSSDDGVTYRHVSGGYPPGTEAAAQHLDRIAAPLELSGRKAAALLRQDGWRGKNNAVYAAVKYRRARPAGSGEHAGEQPTNTTGEQW